MPALNEGLARACGMMATDSRDWSANRHDAWLYGLFCGWDCEEPHEHDDTCGGLEAMDEVATHWGWTPDDVARLRRYREAIAAVQKQEAP